MNNPNSKRINYEALIKELHDRAYREWLDGNMQEICKAHNFTYQRVYILKRDPMMWPLFLRKLKRAWLDTSKFLIDA